MWSGKNTPPTPFKFLPSQTPPRGHPHFAEMGPTLPSYILI
jgi:hypothetical protein